MGMNEHEQHQQWQQQHWRWQQVQQWQHNGSNKIRGEHRGTNEREGDK
jgi:hypothetical protein